jgi:hypothetical protein
VKPRRLGGPGSSTRTASAKANSSPKKKDADARLVKARNQVAQGTFTPESTSKTTKEACDLWSGRARAEDLERFTIDQYKRSVEIILDLH